WRRLGIGRLFAVINLITSTLLLAGVGFVYATAGSVNLAVLAGAATEDGRVAAARGMVLMALCIKAGAVPVHGWLPRSYPGTSSGVMALFSALHTKVALYAVIRIWATAFDLDPAWGRVLLVVALVTTLWGAIASAAPLGIREILAWQMVSGIGVILAALAVASEPGGSIVYLIHHMITIGALIMLFGAAEHAYGSDRLDRLSGLWHRDRPLAVLAVVAIAARVGLPPTSGLIGKLEVVAASLTPGGAWGVVTPPPPPGVPWVIGPLVVVLPASAIALVAMLRLWRGALWGEDLDQPRTATEPSLPARLPARLLVPGGALVAVSVALFLGYGA